MQLEDAIKTILINQQIDPLVWKFYAYEPLLLDKEESLLLEEFISSFEGRIMRIVDNADLTICLTSPYPYVRDCKLWLMKYFP